MKTLLINRRMISEVTLLTFYKLIGRFLRLLPKYTSIKYKAMEAKFFVPINCHYISDDLIQINKGKREPKLYDWLNNIADDSIFFDVGTSYGQEVSLASAFKHRGVKVIGFDCNLHHSHFCCLNKTLNSNRFDFVFAAISDVTGVKTEIWCNSDTHIPQLHKKNVKYSYDVMSLALDDYCSNNEIYPTHLKIDVDGCEDRVLKGSMSLLSNNKLVEIFIEIDNKNFELINTITESGFEIVWREERDLNCEVLFRRKASVQLK